MPFVQGKCENCGGILAVDSSLKAAICPFCGAAYVVQDSINYYNTSIKVENMHADVVNITDESSSEARLKAGEAYLKIGKYDLAEKEYQSVTKIAPQNHLGWLGLIEAKTHNYNKRIKSAGEIKKLNDYSLSVLTLAPNGSGDVLIEKWKYYLKSEEEKNESEKEGLITKISEHENKVKELEDEEKTVDDKIEQKERRLSYIKANYKLDITNDLTGTGCLLGVGLLLSPIGLLLLILCLVAYDPTAITFIIISIIMILVGIGAFFGFAHGKKKINAIRNEASQLEEELRKAKCVKERINGDIKDIQLTISSIQEQLNEYK